MVTIIYGEDTIASRNFYIAAKQKVSDAVSLDGINLTFNDIFQALGGDSLFALEKYISIEELLSKRKPGKELESIIKFINENEKNASIYLWESKELTAKQLKQFNNATIKQFKTPTTIFQFVDNIKPNNVKFLLQSFHKALETEDEQFIFLMMIRQVRLMLALSEGQESTIEEAKRVALWQKTRLQKQAKWFTIDSLVKLYNKLFEIDLAQKTGNLAMSVTNTIDFLLMEI